MRTSSAGLGLAVLSAATFGTSGTFASSLMAAGWSPGAAVSARIAVAALILTIPALVQLRGRWALLRRSLPAVIAYGLVAVAGCQLFFFNAVEHLSVGVALLLEYSGTLLVVLWVWLRHGQRPRRLTVAGAALAIAGWCSSSISPVRNGSMAWACCGDWPRPPGWPCTSCSPPASTIYCRRW